MVRAFPLLLLALAVVGASARPIEAWSEDIIDALKLWSDGRLHVDSSLLDSSARRASDSEEENKFFLVKELIVPPHLACEFAEATTKLRDELKEVEGLNHFQVSRPLTNNRQFFTCEAWDSKDAFMKYIKKSHTEGKKLLKYIMKHDINFQLTQLIPLSEAEDSLSVNHGRLQWGSNPVSSNMAAAANVRALQDGLSSATDAQWTMGGCEADSAALWLAKFIVKPSELKDLVGAARQLTSKVEEQEEGNTLFKFSKDAADDFTVWGYAEWESCEAAKQHLDSPHFKEFKSYVLQHDILASKTPLMAVTKLEECE